MKSTLRIRGAIALLLLLSLLWSVISLPTYAQELDGTYETVESSPTQAEPGSEGYRTRYTAEHWAAIPETGTLLENDTDGVVLDILARGAGMTATLLPYEGQTPCNALQIVLENRSACTEMQLEVVYESGERAMSEVVRLQAYSPRTVYYVYLHDVDEICEVTVNYQAISDGTITLYSFSRVSFYDQLTDEEIHGSISECYYDSTNGNVVISGRLRSESVVEFSGGSILLYRLSSLYQTGSVVDGDAQLLQTLKVSNRFTFVVPAANFAAQNSRYALVLVDTNGNRTLMSEPCYPFYRTTAEQTPPPAQYKGMATADPADAMQAFAGAVIVDVYLDALTGIGGSEDESFAVDEHYYTFDRAYVNRLEREITPFLQVGSEVYLRLLIGANEQGYALPYTTEPSKTSESSEYLAVRLETLDAQLAYGATLQYLLERLTDDGGQIAGVILGRGIDDSLRYHYAGMIPLREYLQTVVAGVLQTQNALRAVCPAARLYLPVTDTEYPTYYTSYDLDGVYATPMLMDGICRMLDDIGLGAFTVYPLLEMTHAPHRLSDALVEQGSDAVCEAISESLTTDGFENQLTVDELAAHTRPYDSAGDGIAVIWMPPTDCTGLTLSLSYIYLYYQLQEQNVSTFFAAPTHADASLCELIAQIDTGSAVQTTSFATPYFPSKLRDRWEGLSQNKQPYLLYSAAMTADSRTIYTGRYSYWNFATAFGTLSWTPGFGCRSLVPDGGSRYGRALLAEMTVDERGGSILYRFREPEDFSICDALALTLAVTDLQGNHVPAKLRLTLYGENERIEATCMLQTGELTTLTLSGLPMSAANSCHAISIALQPLVAEEEGSLRLYLLSIDGMSRLLDDDALQKSILTTRELRGETAARQPMGAYPILLLTALLLLTVAGAFLCLRASKKRKTLR